GNTLYPETSLAAGFAADLSGTSHLLIRLRILHPTFAVLTAVGLLFGAPRLAGGRGPRTVTLARVVAGLAAAQLVLGAVNVLLLAPVWMQMIHLLVADLLWIAFILLGASVLAIGVEAESTRAVRGPNTLENLHLQG
ncbi:MAG: COX15/CtaA family protein, partial [Acidobacteriota bacterium]|nr:COX15/CtaA family protein [Acidobacteriota bacterium]